MSRKAELTEARIQTTETVVDGLEFLSDRAMCNNQKMCDGHDPGLMMSWIFILSRGGSSATGSVSG